MLRDLVFCGCWGFEVVLCFVLERGFEVVFCFVLERGFEVVLSCASCWRVVGASKLPQVCERSLARES